MILRVEVRPYMRALGGVLLLEHGADLVYEADRLVSAVGYDEVDLLPAGIQKLLDGIKQAIDALAVPCAYENAPALAARGLLRWDNIGLFASSIVSLSEYGYTIHKCSLDLHNEDMENFQTEYEKKFSEKGQKINYLDAVKE